MAGSRLRPTLMPTPWTIRQAEPCDAEAVAALAQALSEYEGMPPTLFTPDVFLRDGFGVAPPFRVAVAELAGPAGEEMEVVGFALFYPGYDVATATRGTHLADLFVKETWRSCGIGRALVAYVSRATLGFGGVWMSWTVLEKNADAQAFYKTMGANPVGVRFMAAGKTTLVDWAME